MSILERRHFSRWTRGALPLVLLLGAVALIFFLRPAPEDRRQLESRGSASAQVVITPGKLPTPTEPHVPDRQVARQETPPGVAAPAACAVPEIDESLQGKDIVFDKGVPVQASGGSIEPGRYRLRTAASADPNFGPGRWSFLIDLAKDGRGAFYRKLGFRPMRSRIRWSTEGESFRFEMLCPDSGQKREFRFTALGSDLLLFAAEGIVLTLERYGDSQMAATDDKP